MTQFHVDSVALDSATVHIGATIDRITSDIATMSGQLRSLDGSWTGPAALAFSELMNEWTVASSRLTESLAGIGAALRHIHTHYLETEAMNVRLLGG
jgi:early secretory antigenic target protein ESAT-6